MSGCGKEYGIRKYNYKGVNIQKSIHSMQSLARNILILWEAARSSIVLQVDLDMELLFIKFMQVWRDDNEEER